MSGKAQDLIFCLKIHHTFISTSEASPRLWVDYEYRLFIIYLTMLPIAQTILQCQDYNM
jgi:hypothetical protein